MNLGDWRCSYVSALARIAGFAFRMADPPTGAASWRITSSVPGVEFSRELRNDVLAGDITLSVRLWKRPQVKQGGRYRVGSGEIGCWTCSRSAARLLGRLSRRS